VRALSRALVVSACLVGVGVLALPWPSASAQEAPVGNVDIAFEIGAFDPGIEDWSVEAVKVSGDLEEGQDFTVEVLGKGDVILWFGTQPFAGPVTRVALTSDVAVGDVTSAGVSQGLTIVAGVQVEPPPVDWAAAGGGGSGQLALSMVMAVIVVAIVFRSPLPSASTQRWTK
jgi:hypothetical protein